MKGGKRWEGRKGRRRHEGSMKGGGRRGEGEG